MSPTPREALAKRLLEKAHWLRNCYPNYLRSAQGWLEDHRKPLAELMTEAAALLSAPDAVGEPTDEEMEERFANWPQELADMVRPVADEPALPVRATGEGRLSESGEPERLRRAVVDFVATGMFEHIGHPAHLDCNKADAAAEGLVKRFERAISAPQVESGALEAEYRRLRLAVQHLSSHSTGSLADYERLKKATEALDAFVLAALRAAVPQPSWFDTSDKPGFIKMDMGQRFEFLMDELEKRGFLTREQGLMGRPPELCILEDIDRMMGASVPAEPTELVTTCRCGADMEAQWECKHCGHRWPAVPEQREPDLGVVERWIVDEWIPVTNLASWERTQAAGERIRATTPDKLRSVPLFRAPPVYIGGTPPDTPEVTNGC